MSSKRNAKLLKAVLSAAPAICMLSGNLALGQNNSFIYNPGGTTDLWSTGASWSPSAPVSGNTTALVYEGTQTATLTAGQSSTSVNNLGNFSLNELDLQGTGFSVGFATAITVAGNTTSDVLNFVNNGTTDPVVNLNANSSGAPVLYNVSDNVTLTNNVTFQGAGTAGFNFSGNISGPDGIIKTGTSTLILSGTNTYLGQTTISGGTLRATQTSALSGFNSAGSVNLTAGTLAVSAGGTGWTSGNIDTLLANLVSSPGSNFAINVDGANNFTYNSNISNTFALNKSGNGILTIGGNNSYTGNTNLAGGQLNLATATAIGISTFVASGSSILDNTSGTTMLLNNNPVSLNGTLTFAGTNDLNFGTGTVTFGATRGVIVRNGTLTFGGPLNGTTFGLVKGGAGTLALTNSGNVYGDTTINGGVLAEGTTGVLGTGDLTLANGELNVAGQAGSARPITAGTFNTNSGRDTITLVAGSGGSVTLTAGSFSNRANYSTTLYRGTSLGTAAPGPNVTNIFFSTPLTVNQGGGGTVSGGNTLAAIDGTGALLGPAAAVLRGALTDTTATGNGTSFATYDPTFGVRALKTGEQISTVTANDNVKLSLAAGTTTFTGALVNTLQLDNTSGSAAVATFSGTAGSFAPVNGLLFSGNSPITLSTQNVLTVGGNAQSTAYDAVFLSTNTAGATVGNATLSVTSGTASNRGYTLGGPGLLTVGGLGGVASNGAVTITGPGTVTFNGAVSTSSGGIVVAGGTLKLGPSFSIFNTNSQRDFVVASGATFDLNGITMSGNNAYEALDNLNGAGGTVTNSAGTLATLTLSHFQDVGTNRTFSGVITGNLNFALNTQGAITGTQTLANTSTYTGSTTITSGTLLLGATNALPTTTTLSINGGGANVSALDLNGFSQTVDTLAGTISTSVGTIQNSVGNTTSVFTVGGVGAGTYSGVITDNPGTGGAIALVRSGTGSVTLTGTNTYSGGTTINGGLLQNNGSLSNVKNRVTVNGGALGGSGSIAGPVVTTGSGAHLAPGSGVGTLTLNNTFSVANGTEFDYELVASGNNDVIDASNVTNGFTLNGGVFNLLTPGGATAFSTPGTYNLIKFAGAIQGTGLDTSWTNTSPTNAHVLDPQLFKSYAFGSSGGFLTLTINSTTTTATWTGTASNTWGSGATNANWNNSVTPGAQGDTAIFGSGASKFLVNLDGSRTVGAITLNSATPYTIAQGSPGGTLFLDESTGIANILDSNGSHLISAPVNLSSNTTATVVNASDMVTVSGNISGTAALTKAGSGALALSGSNSHAGGTMINAGTLIISADNNLGPGQTTINGGALQTSTTLATGRNFQLGSATSTMDVEGTASLELDGSVANAATPGTLNKTGPGTLIINGNVTATGGVVIANGNVLLGNGTTGGSLGTVPLNIGATGALTVNRTGSTVIGGPLSGTGNLTVPTGTSVTLGGTNTAYAGSISVTGATLVLGNSTGVGSANIGLNNSTLTENTSSTISTLSTVTFSGMNVVGNDTIDAGGFTLGLAAQLSGSGTITRIGTGTVSLGVGAGTGFSNSFFGGTFINSSGTLDFTSRLSGSRNASWIINGGTVTVSQPNGGSTEIGLLQGNNPTVPFIVTAATARLSIGSLNGVSTFAGPITSSGGSFALVKVGTGTLTLSGQNTFNGTDGVTFTSLFAGFPVIVSAGTLVAGSSTTGNTSGPFGGAPTYNSSGTLTGGAAILLGSNSTLATAALMTGGAVTVSNDIMTSGGDGTMETPGSYTLSLGGTTDNTSTFSGKITLQNNLTVTQAATTGTNALVLSGGIYGFQADIGPNTSPNVLGLENTGFQTVTFAGAGSVNVTGNIADADPNPTNIYGITDGSGGGVVAVTSTGGTTRLSGNNAYSGLTTVAGGTLILSTNAQNIVLNGPSKGVINSGRMVFEYNGSTHANLVSQVTSSLNRSQFLNQFQSSGGTQLYTSNSTESTQAHGIGWFDNPTTSQLTVRYTWLGDANLDGTVNALDLNAVATDFGKSSQVWAGGDFDYTGNVNMLDFNYIAMNFGQVMAAAPLPLSGQPLLGTLVPEPTSLGLIGLGMALGVRRRRR